MLCAQHLSTPDNSLIPLTLYCAPLESKHTEIFNGADCAAGRRVVVVSACGCWPRQGRKMLSTRKARPKNSCWCPGWHTKNKAPPPYRTAYQDKESLTGVLEEESREANDHVVLLACWELRERHVAGSWAQGETERERARQHPDDVRKNATHRKTFYCCMVERTPTNLGWFNSAVDLAWLYISCQQVHIRESTATCSLRKPLHMVGHI